MKQKYVVLRVPPTASKNVFRGATHDNPTQTLPSVNLEELSQRERAELARDSSFAVAPTMPMKLIEPVKRSVGASASGEARGLTWGVRAVKAHQSPFTGVGVVVAVLDTGITLDY